MNHAGPYLTLVGTFDSAKYGPGGNPQPLGDGLQSID